jgi:hypothetical protein
VIGQGMARLIMIVLVAAAAAGCGTTAPARFFNLDSTAVADGAPATHGTVMVGPLHDESANFKPPQRLKIIVSKHRCILLQKGLE